MIYNSKGKAFFPYLVSNHRGQLLATWFDLEEETLTGRIAHIDATDATPIVTVAGPMRLQAWKGDEPDTAGEYITAEFLPDGDIGAVTPVQDGANNRYGFSFWRFRLR